MLRNIIDKETGELRITADDETIFSDSDYRCWKFKDCSNLIDYLKTYMNCSSSDVDLEESAYQYVYDESEDWFHNEWTSADVEKAFKAGAMWMKSLMENQ